MNPEPYLLVDLANLANKIVHALLVRLLLAAFLNLRSSQIDRNEAKNIIRTSSLSPSSSESPILPMCLRSDGEDMVVVDDWADWMLDVAG